MNRNSIAIIAAYRHTSEFLAEEIRDLLELHCDIRTFYVEEEDNLDTDAAENWQAAGNQYQQRIRQFDFQDCSVVVFSSEAIRKLVTGLTDVTIPQVVTKRNIDMGKVPEIIGIESGTQVYAFGSSREAAEELIEELKETGINHLRLTPYFPGATPIRNGIIITPGKFMVQMVGARRIIDVEFRTLRISTVMEIFIALNLPASRLSRIEHWYQQKIRSMNEYNTTMNKNVTGILEAINEGIFCVSAEGRVLFCNRTFLTLIDMDYYDVAGKHCEEIGFGPQLSGLLHYHGNLFSEIVEYGSRRLLINRLETPRRSPAETAAGFVISMQDVTRIHELETDVRKKLARRGFVAKYTADKIISQSSIMKEKIQETLKIAASDHTVLLTGDNGTGKEMFAQVIHNQSQRASNPFVAVNLASLSDSIIESEIFGYEEGAFTGAAKGGKAGLFEMAHNGTIFIDEIGDVSLHIQQRLLRVLQEREVMRMGARQIIPVNVRVIAATNKNLFQMVQEGSFRMDLYYRLKVLHINIPALKERLDDIPLLLDHFFKEVRSKKHMSAAALGLLQSYSWPGNVRELENLVYYLETLCEHREVLPGDLPEEFRGSAAQEANADQTSGVSQICNPVHASGLEELFELIAASTSSQVLDQLRFILTQLQLAESSGITMGRKRIHQLSLQRKNGSITVEQLRSRFYKLEQYGLIHVGTTRQGSTITEKGQAFLEWSKSLSS